MILKKSLLLIFFSITLFIGLNIYRDYGVHWDEYNNQEFGHKWKIYVVDVVQHASLLKARYPQPDLMDWLHGSIVEISLNFIKNTLNIHDLKEIILFRHLSCFLIFIVGILFFYLLCLRYFKDWKISLLGSLFLILSPRIFAHSFYDTFDIPFLTFNIICIYTLIRWLDNQSLLNAIIHATCCAILVDTRIAGLIIPAVTVFFYIFNFIKSPQFEIKNKLLLQGTIYILFLSFLIILAWPLLWPNPIVYFSNALHETLTSNFPYSCLFLGKFYMGYDLPWYGVWVWIFVTTPLMYCFFFLLGLIFQALSKPTRDSLIILFLFFIPLIFSQGKTYNGWRHLYFVYPLFIIICLTGIKTFWSIIQKSWIFKNLLIIGITFCLIETALTMAEVHPYQQVYFNQLAGKTPQEIKSRFELDYWGLSYRQALEFLAKDDASPIIKVSLGNNQWPLIKNNLNMLIAEDKKRFVETSPFEATYLITNYLQHPQDYTLEKYASIKINDLEILGIYKLK